MPETISILVADHHPVFRRGLRELIEHERGFVFAGEAMDGERAVALARELRPNLLLLDLAMPRRTGLEALRTLSMMGLQTRTAVLTATVEDEQVREAVQLGVGGFLSKDIDVKMLIKAIRRIVEGEFVVGRNSAGLAGRLPGCEAREVAPAGKFGLTPRELAVVASVVEGHTTKNIAKRLAMSEHTVKRHVTNIFDKVGVSSRLELALFGHNHRLVPSALRPFPAALPYQLNTNEIETEA